MTIFDPIIEACSVALARQHNLVCADGSIVCWACGERYALLPSLHCGQCLGAAYARNNIITPWCVNREQQIKEAAE